MDEGDSVAARLRAALRTAAGLPSETSIRYAALVCTVAATTSVMYLRFWLDRFGLASDYQRCAADLLRLSTARPGGGDAVFQLWLGQLRQTQDCLRPEAATALWAALAGLAALTLVAVAHYVLLPGWHIRSRRLIALDDAAPVPIRSCLDRLVARSGLTRSPHFWLAPMRSTPHAVAFGTGRRCHVQLNDGLLELYYCDSTRPRFEAVVLHELAHVRNRDIGYTYATLAVWRAFMLVGLLPYAALRVLPMLLGLPHGWTIAPMTLNALRPQALVSMAVLAVLVYLTYFSILRTRETQADLTSAAIGDPEALRALLSRQAQPRLTALRRHPSPSARLRSLADPLRPPSGRPLLAIGAGVAIAMLQYNLNSLLVPAYLVLAPGADPSTMDNALWLALNTNLVGAFLLSGLVTALVWQELVREPRGRGTPRSLLMAGAITFGLLLGEPLSLYHAGGGSWAVPTAGGAASLWTVAVSVAALFLLLAALFAWARESGRVWLPLAGKSLRRILLVAAIAGALGLFPFYAAWTGYHYSEFMVRPYDWQTAVSGWESTWEPPLRALIFAESLPIYLTSMLAPARELMLAPLAFVMVALLRQSPRAVVFAFRAGALLALAALAAVVVLAYVTWQWGGPREGQNVVGAAQYAMFATIFVAVVGAGVASAVIAFRAHPARGSLALLAALAATAVAALLSAIPPLVVLCRGVEAGACLSIAWWPMNEASLGWTVTLATPRTIVAGCLAAALGTAAGSLLGSRARLESDQPGQVLRLGAVGACLLLLAVLTIGNYLGSSLGV